jgi:hypothetical protein
MAKNAAGEGKGTTKNKSAEEHNATRRATKAGKNRNKVAAPRPTNVDTVSPSLLVQRFDVQDVITRMALNSRSVQKLRDGSPSREIAILAITRYGVEKRRGGTPVEWHATRRNAAMETVTFIAADLKIAVESKAFQHGITVAVNALNDAQTAMEFCRARELRDLAYNKFDVAEICVRFTPPPAPANEEEAPAEDTQAVSA